MDVKGHETRGGGAADHETRASSSSVPRWVRPREGGRRDMQVGREGHPGGFHGGRRRGWTVGWRGRGRPAVGPFSSSVRCRVSAAGDGLYRSAASGPSVGSGDLSQLTDPDELAALIALLPPHVRAALEEHPRKLQLLEVVLDLGRRPLARFADGDVVLSESVLGYDDLTNALETVGDVGADNRAGINRTLHRISVIRNRHGGVVGLTCRVGRAIRGSAELVRDLLTSGRSVLLLGRPGVGKTTAIREISRVLSDECGRRVVVVDTSNEIGGDGDIPHGGIGGARRMQVPRPDVQHEVLIEAVQNHTPEVVIVDEIGTELEAAAARTISQRGVQMIATAHGHSLENLLKNPALNDLVGGVVSVTLGDDEARRRRVQKSVLEREGPPTFGAAVEMNEIGEWRVHLDVGVAVDTLLAGYEPSVELRTLDAASGNVRVQPWLGGGPGGGGYGTMFGPGGPVGGGVGFGGGWSADAFGGASGVTRGVGAASAGSSRGMGIPGGIAGMPTGLADGGAGYHPPERQSSSRLAAEEVAAAAVARGRDGGVSPSVISPAPTNTNLFYVYPYGLDCDMLEEVIASLGLEDRVALTTVLEEAAAVLAVKSQVKGATWLRHAARVRGMPIYALKVEGIPQLARALQAMLGLTLGSPGASEGEAEYRAGSASDSGRGVSKMAAATAAVARGGGLGGAGGETARRSSGDSFAEMGVSTAPAAVSTVTASSFTPAEEADALEEVRMAVEQLVIPHQEAVELLPRDGRLMALQAELITE